MAALTRRWLVAGVLVSLIVGGAPTLAATAAAVTPQLTFSRTSIDFGTVQQWSSSAQEDIVVTNVSGSPLRVTGAGGADEVFGGRSDCNGRTLPAGGTC